MILGGHRADTHHKGEQMVCVSCTPRRMRVSTPYIIIDLAPCAFDAERDGGNLDAVIGAPSMGRGFGAIRGAAGGAF